MQRKANIVGANGENLAYGLITGKEAVIGLIVDDGVPDRGHRTNVFNAAWVDVGNFFGKHLTYGTGFCQNFAYGSYSIKEASYAKLSSAFMNEVVDWTASDGIPSSGYTKYSYGSEINLEDWKMHKTAFRTYFMNDGTSKPFTKHFYRDLPARQGIYLS